MRRAATTIYHVLFHATAVYCIYVALGGIGQAFVPEPPCVPERRTEREPA